MNGLDREIRRVVEGGLCSGCGACCLLDDGLRMELDDAGFRRPVRVAPGSGPDAAVVGTFRRVCPGREVRAGRAPGVRRHPTMGPWVSAWQGWATDPAFRHRGSSGGVLSALNAWLLDTGELTEIVGAAMDPSAPSRTVPVTIHSSAEALAAAGSRYAPVAVAAAPSCGPGGERRGLGVVGKPCEISALRALHGSGDGAGEDVPLLLSFYCAGTPSQHATDALVEDLGHPSGQRVAELWYRGRGWPGRFSVVAADGAVRDTSYDESWGRRLGPAVQWRCKICPDGIGESSDITAADFWTADEQGYPLFTEGDGVSAVIARTGRGDAVLRRAVAAGVLTLSPLDLDRLAAVQPFQVQRRSTLAARLLGARLGGRPGPRYRGFGLLRLAAARPRAAVRVARGTLRRVRAGAAR